MTTKSTHRHKAKTRTTRGYFGGAYGAKHQEPRAAGGVCFVETCACGARRETNSNGRFEERGTWREKGA